MNDREIERMILKEIKNRGITWLDMVGGRSISYDVDHQRVVRNNMFEAESWPDRLIELIGVGEYDQHAEHYVMRVSIQDLMRFWWNNCISREDMVDDILEDIYTHFKDMLLPEEEVKPGPDYDVDFSRVIPKPIDILKKAAGGAK